MTSMSENKILLAYQKTLIYMWLEDISAVFMLSGIAGGQGANEDGAWVEAVADFIFSSLRGGLIYFSSGEEFFSAPENFDSIRMDYSSSDPESKPEIWMGVQYSATENLIEILQSFELLNWESISSDLKPGLADKISAIYRNNSA